MFPFDDVIMTMSNLTIIGMAYILNSFEKGTKIELRIRNHFINVLTIFLWSLVCSFEGCVI